MKKQYLFFVPQFNGCKIIYFDNTLDDKIFLRYNAICNEMEISLSPFILLNQIMFLKR